MAPVCQLEMTFPGFEEPWGARVEMHENRLEATRYLSMDHSKEHKKRGLAGLGRLTAVGVALHGGSAPSGNISSCADIGHNGFCDPVIYEVACAVDD
jgi:hypothetical protein